MIIDAKVYLATALGATACHRPLARTQLRGPHGLSSARCLGLRPILLMRRTSYAAVDRMDIGFVS
jgi:hypothetical protein